MKQTTIRTKIVATMGPATASVETLLKIFEAGADVCRLNFSHGSLEGHLQMLRTIREAAARFDQPIAVLGDLCGPKIRLGVIENCGETGGMPIKVGDELIIQRSAIAGKDGRVSTNYLHFIDEVNVGDRVLIEDGLLRFVVTDKNFNELRLQTLAGGILKTGKGVNLPNTAISIPSITDRDWECTDWAIENDLDYLALSFVRKADDIHLLRQHLRNKVSDIHIISKIEKAEAIKDIEAILEASDGLMVARGDLGVEMDVAQVPIMQKDLIRRCQVAGKPVIVATQMLQSMIEQASPTRAEVSDVANAIFDGTDAVMLSGETSVGKFPVGAVHTMGHVAATTENYVASTREAKEPVMRLKMLQLSGAIAKGVWQMVHDLDLKLVAIWSQTGGTARIFSKARFPVPIVALSSDHRALRRMALHYGVVPQEMLPPRDTVALVQQMDKMVQEKGYAEAGDRIVIVAGASMGTPGTMNSVIIHTVGEMWHTAPDQETFPATAIPVAE
jgi:pyruvate kinase